MQVEIRAYPAQGHEYRRRAGFAWPRGARVVNVVEIPSAKRTDDQGFAVEVTPSELEQIKGDPMIAVVPVGTATTGDLDAARTAAELAARTKELADARADFSRATEEIETLKRAMTAREGEVAARIATLQGEIEALRAKGGRR